jgi:hypothetical protein
MKADGFNAPGYDIAASLEWWKVLDIPSYPLRNTTIHHVLGEMNKEL